MKQRFTPHCQNYVRGPLRDVNAAFFSVMKYSKQENGFGNRFNMIIVPLLRNSSGRCASREAALDNPPARRVPRYLAKAVLVDGRHRRVTVQNLVAVDQCKRNALLRVSMVFSKRFPALTPQEGSCESSMAARISSIGLSEQLFVNHVQSIILYPSMFETECDINFCKAWTTHFTKDSPDFPFPTCPVRQICCRYTRVAKYMFAFSAVLWVFIEKAPSLFGVTHLYENTFLSSDKTDVVLLKKQSRTVFAMKRSEKMNSSPSFYPRVAVKICLGTRDSVSIGFAEALLLVWKRFFWRI